MGGDDDVKGNQEGAQDEPQGAKDQDDAQGQPQGGTPEGGQVAGSEADWKALLSERDARISELEAQVATAAESKATAEELSKRIEELKEEAAAERLGYELRLAGCRDEGVALAVIGDHGGNVGQLKADLPWMFADEGTQQGGTTGLEPAGAAGGSDDADLRRWEDIAGLEHETKE